MDEDQANSLDNFICQRCKSLTSKYRGGKEGDPASEGSEPTQTPPELNPSPGRISCIHFRPSLSVLCMGFADSGEILLYNTFFLLASTTPVGSSPVDSPSTPYSPPFDVHRIVPNKRGHTAPLPKRVDCIRLDSEHLIASFSYYGRADPEIKVSESAGSKQARVQK